VPASDLVVAAREVASVADIPRRLLTLKLIDKALLSDDVVRLTLMSARGERMRRLAGQYLDVLLAGGRRRAFSIANAPSRDDDAIELHVRRVAGGDFTNTVFDVLETGATLDVEGPLGTFVPREDSERPMIFMAGGTGFAPVKAIIEHFIALGTRRPIRFYWGARSADELYLRELAEQWARDVPGLDFHPVVSDAARADGLRTGLVHEAVLADWPDLSGHDLYMSGPPAMIDAAHPRFLAAGLPEDRLYYDSFEYAPDVLAQIIAGRAGIHDLPL
jgi:CDP-4-dehydro-6-deoxyglucose reductase